MSTHKTAIPEDRHGRAPERAYNIIRERIIDNSWDDGEFLREGELAEQIGISRTPVRDALRRLSAEGLVEIIPNVGTRVRQWTNRDLDEIFGLRSQLEGYAASLAATRITMPQIEVLRQICDESEEMVQAGRDGRSKRERLHPLNDQFHSLILAASGNARLETIAKQVISVPLVLRTFTRYAPEEIARSLSHHRELVAAFEARDPVWAESVMRSHVHAGYVAMTRNRSATPP